MNTQFCVCTHALIVRKTLTDQYLKELKDKRVLSLAKEKEQAESIPVSREVCGRDITLVSCVLDKEKNEGDVPMSS